MKTTNHTPQGSSLSLGEGICPKDRWVRIVSNTIILAILLITSCQKDNSQSPPAANGVYIVNEGNFNFGNAEISFYDPATNQVSNKLFQNANGYALGDVAQSMYVKDTLGFIVVNNSAKVEVVALPSFKKLRTINIPGSSPRYFLPVSNTLAYVSDLYAGKVHVVNYQTGDLVSQMDVPTKWSENIIASPTNTNVYIETREAYNSSTRNSGIAVVATGGNVVFENHKISQANTSSFTMDVYQNMIVAKAADTALNIKPVIYFLSNNFTLVDSIVLNSGGNANGLCTNKAKDRFYFYNNNGVYRFSNYSDCTLLIPANGRNIYGLGIDPSNGDIYISDALDYVQSSRIYRYDKDGAEINSFTAGIISGNFAFRYE